MYSSSNRLLTAGCLTFPDVALDELDPITSSSYADSPRTCLPTSHCLAGHRHALAISSPYPLDLLDLYQFFPPVAVLHVDVVLGRDWYGYFHDLLPFFGLRLSSSFDP